MELEDARSNRRVFLRRLGKTAAVGLGIALFPAAAAQAAPTSCCPELDSHCTGVNCSYGHTLMYCSSIQCCFCESRLVYECINYQYPPC
jgi:hypothetical protein